MAEAPPSSQRWRRVVKARSPMRWIIKDTIHCKDTRHARKFTIKEHQHAAVEEFLANANHMERAAVEARVKELTPVASRGELITTRVKQKISSSAASELEMSGHTVIDLLTSEPKVLQALVKEHDAAHGTAAFKSAIEGNEGRKPSLEQLELLQGTRTHANLQAGSHMVARAARLPPTIATLAARAAVCRATGIGDDDIDYVLAMLSIPGGLGNLVHTDGEQHNLAIMLALEDSTAPTRFVDAGSLRTSVRGGVQLERLAYGKAWSELPAGSSLRAGEAVLFCTRWWHAGPGQGPGFRRVIFFPLTGGTKDRQGQSEFVKRPRKV